VGLLHEKNHLMLLRRLTGGEDIKPLKMLADILEPLKGYERHRHGVKYTQFSPYTRMVDACRADAKMARNFNETVDLFLGSKDRKAATELLNQTGYWKSGLQELEGVISRNPVLFEIKPHAETLAAITGMIPEFIGAIKEGKHLSQDKIEKANDLLKTVKPWGQLEMPVLKGFEKLLKGCAP